MLYSEEQFVQKATEIVEENLSEPDFGVDDFMKYMGMSRSQVYRKFKTMTNQSVNEFVKNIRLKKASELLIQGTDCYISEIAYLTGFKTYNYFVECFKRKFNVSPSEYIENNRKPREG